MTPDLLSSLRASLSSRARVETGTATRVLYARDCWPRLLIETRAGRHALFPPDAVVLVDREEDAVSCVRWCIDRRVPLVPVGGASAVTGAAVPVRGGIVLDVKGLDSLDLSRAERGLVRAGAGWIGARLEHELNRHGLTLGHFPSSLGCSTLGGYIATRSAGQLSTRHGKIEDMVVSSRYVNGHGKVQSSFGGRHDDGPLLVGSEGMFGLVLDAWLRVEPRPTARRYRGFLAPDLETGLAGMRELLQEGARPAVLRLYDGFDTRISGARKAGKGGRKRAEEVAATEESALMGRLSHWLSGRVDGRSMRNLALRGANALAARVGGATSLLNRVADRSPGGCLLITGVEEADEALAESHGRHIVDLLSERMKDLGATAGDHWYEHRYDVSYKQSPIFEAGLFVDTMEVAATWDRLDAMYRAVRDAVSSYAFVMAHFSHAYASGSSIYFTFAGFGRDDEECLERYDAIWRLGLAAVARTGGSVTHHHGVGLLKGPRLHEDHSGGAPLFAGIRASVDPAGVLNPGKMWEAKAP